jgi:soluble lytic murein transglycosylase-like protein
MNRRKLPIVPLTAAAAVAVAAAVPTSSAQADQRMLVVTLATGAQITVTVDVPAGTPLNQVEIPGVTGTIVSIADAGAVAAAPAPTDTTPTTTAPVDPTVTATTPTTTDPATTPTTTATTPTTTATTPAQDPAADADATAAGGDPANGPQATKNAKTQRKAQKTTDVKGSKAGDASGDSAEQDAAAAAKAKAKAKTTADGSPTAADPTYSLSVPGAAVIGVPNFFISKFRIPPFLLPIYQAAGIEYGVRWEVLAAINEIETDYGRNLNVSSAGAVGWMQFMPSTWKRYGVDANDDGSKDPYNPVDAIFAAARYLKAAGAADNLQKAIFAYNHADWYVDSVVLRARLISGLPADFVGSLTGLTQGRFPVHATSTYADAVSTKAAKLHVGAGQSATIADDADANRRSIDIYSRPHAPVIAVQDGRVIAMGTSKALGRYLRLRDAYGNTYTYAHLGSVVTEIAVPKETKVSAKQVKRELKLKTAGTDDPKPTQAATAGTHPAATKAAKQAAATVSATATAKARLFAHPTRANALKAGGRDQILDAGGSVPAGDGYTASSSIYPAKGDKVVIKRLKVGSKVVAGTILGRLGRKTADGGKPHLTFSMRPAGRGAPMIDPKPILDGWKLLESTAIYRAAGRNALLDGDSTASVGQLLLMSKEQLQLKVLDDPNIEIYDAGRADIQSGAIDRRVLATLAFLSASGLRPTVSALKSGHSYLTDSGNVSEHSSGNAVDIAKINGIPILGHQGEGSIADITIRRLLALQGTLKPHQIISLMTYPGNDNTLAMADHADHIHIGFQPLDGKDAVKFASILKPGQWTRLMSRLEKLDNPTVSLAPSKYALPVTKTSTAKSGD